MKRLTCWTRSFHTKSWHEIRVKVLSSYTETDWVTWGVIQKELHKPLSPCALGGATRICRGYELNIRQTGHRRELDLSMQDSPEGLGCDPGGVAVPIASTHMVAEGLATGDIVSTHNRQHYKNTWHLNAKSCADSPQPRVCSGSFPSKSATILPTLH